MDTEKYKIVFMPTAIREIYKIYDYISKDLYAEKAAIKLMRNIEEEVLRLKYAPKIHSKIEKIDSLNRMYRRIVIKNYVVLYTIDETNSKVYIVHIYYSKTNYLNFQYD